MTELLFKGKEFVFNHHLTVPHHPLVPHAEKSVLPAAADGAFGEARLDGNLIVHGDNLLALKTLLPRYAGKVDCIFIDPPYNTGHEGWSYNDNVNSPLMQAWLKSNPIGIEDGLRHDKWLAMMWPRLRLLHELLSDAGSFWMTLDDNEVHRARSVLDEIFGASHCVGQLAWQKRTSRENRAPLSPSIDHLLLYSKRPPNSWKLIRNLVQESDDEEEGEDAEDSGSAGTIPFSAQGYRKNQVYKIETPTGKIHDPPKGRCWGATEPEFLKLKAEDRIYWPRKGNGRPRVIPVSGASKGLVPNTLWLAREVGDTEDSKKLLLEIFAERNDVGIHAPKPHQLIERIIQISTNSNSVVLDSFAGSGTTAHAVLAANRKDSGNRKFILVESETYADTLTAERVRRVIHGYASEGKQKEELLKENLTWTSLKQANKLLDKVALIEAQNSPDPLADSPARVVERLRGEERPPRPVRFDRIVREVKDGVLIVSGEKTVTERTEGLGGTFTYCTLGPALEMEALLSGEGLPSFNALGALAYHMATNAPRPALSAPVEVDGCGYLGESTAFHVWLIYRPDTAFLKGREAALTLSRAQALVAAKPDGKPHLVFAAAKFVSQKLLADAGIKVGFAPLPFALYRLERG